MATTTELKEYLLSEKSGFLLNPDNNHKTIMLSGVWGCGKTHFWQNIIEPELVKKLKKDNRACIYVSLYGKDNLQDIKQEIFLKASKEKDYLSEEIEVFGFEVLSALANNGGEIAKGLKAIFDLNVYRKSSKGKNRLKDGGIICFDDFERKSKNIDLNDLFGFISQLAITLRCKVVIILNSDVFEGEESKVFKSVKEKTISKFFYFEPTLKELFEAIYSSDEKYKILDDYKEELFKAITETKELNARIFIQVLDNVLEWIENNKYNKFQIRALVLITTNFVKNDFVLDYTIIKGEDKTKLYNVLKKYYKDEGLYEISKYFIKTVPQFVESLSEEEFEKYVDGDRTIEPIGSMCTCEEFLHQMHSSISKKEADSNGKVKSDNYYARLDKVFQENKEIFYALNYYAYVLEVERDVEKEIFIAINKFVKTGILPNIVEDKTSVVKLTARY